MNARNIAIIIVITAIFAAIAFTMLQKEPGIEKVIITGTPGFTGNEDPGSISSTDSFNSNADIFIVIFVKNIKKDSVFKVTWTYFENGTEVPVQEDLITSNKEGSGTVSVSLAKKDGLHKPGAYKTTVLFDGKEPLINEFNVK